MVENKILCRQCGEIMHSTHRHDFQRCNCPNKAFTDGGADYQRIGAVDLTKVAVWDGKNWRELKNRVKHEKERKPNKDSLHFVCWKCRLTFKSIRKTLKCPNCFNYMNRVGNTFRAPKTTDKKAWKELQDLYEKGNHFYSKWHP